MANPAAAKLVHSGPSRSPFVLASPVAGAYSKTISRLIIWRLPARAGIRFREQRRLLGLSGVACLAASGQRRARAAGRDVPAGAGARLPGPRRAAVADRPGRANAY